MAAGIVLVLLAAVLLLLGPAAGQRQQCGRSSFSPPGDVSAAFAEEAAHFPWLVSVGSASRRHCAGAVISDRWILTGATCVPTDALPTVYSAVLNISDPSEPRVRFNIARAVLHPKYARRTNQSHDIALLETSAPISFSGGMEPLCLPDPQQQRSAVLTGQTLVVAGWGAPMFRTTDNPPRLKWAKLTVTDVTECKRNYTSLRIPTRYFVEDAFCTKLDQPTGPFLCGLNQGDQGTALMAEMTENGVRRWYAAGLAVAGTGCGHPKFNDINVALRQSSEWITSLISQK